MQENFTLKKEDLDEENFTLKKEDLDATAFDGQIQKRFFADASPLVCVWSCVVVKSMSGCHPVRRAWDW